MPTKRKGGATWDFVVQRKGALPKPLDFAFRDVAEGDARAEFALLPGLLLQSLPPAHDVDVRTFPWSARLAGIGAGDPGHCAVRASIRR